MKYTGNALWHRSKLDTSARHVDLNEDDSLTPLRMGYIHIRTGVITAPAVEHTPVCCLLPHA